VMQVSGMVLLTVCPYQNMPKSDAGSGPKGSADIGHVGVGEAR